jgi:hypothetical protein
MSEIFDIFSKIDTSRKVKIKSEGNVVKLFVPLKSDYDSLEIIVTCANEQIAQETKQKLAEGVQKIFEINWNQIIPLIEPFLRGLKLQ